MHIMGCSFQDSASYLIKTFDLPMTIEEYGRLNEEQYEILFAHPKLMPGKYIFILYMLSVFVGFLFQILKRFMT